MAPALLIAQPTNGGTWASNGNNQYVASGTCTLAGASIVATATYLQNGNTVVVNGNNIAPPPNWQVSFGNLPTGVTVTVSVAASNGAATLPASCTATTT